MTVFSPDLIFVRISDHSCEPIYAKGSILIARSVGKLISPFSFYVLKCLPTDFTLVCKPEYDIDTDKYRLTFANKDYPPIIITRSEFKVLGVIMQSFLVLQYSISIQADQFFRLVA